MLHCDIELHRFTLTMNLQRHLVACISARGQVSSEVELLINGIDVVAVVIEIEIADGGEDIAFLQAVFLHRATRLDPPNINAASAVSRVATILEQWLVL